MHRSQRLADIEAHSSRFELTLSRGSADRPQARCKNDHSFSLPDVDRTVAGGIMSAEYPAAGQYFRQPRHSSTRGHPTTLEDPLTTIMPSHESFASAANTSIGTSSDISQPALLASDRLVSSSQSAITDDDWNDTRSVPLGPRWQDFTYREGDSFYGKTSRTAIEPSAITGSALPTKRKSAAALHGTIQSMSGAVSALRSSIVSTLRAEQAQPQNSGFEVVRPTRVFKSEDQTTSLN